MQCVHNGGHFLLYRSSLRSTLKLAEQGYWQLGLAWDISLAKEGCQRGNLSS